MRLQFVLAHSAADGEAVSTHQLRAFDAIEAPRLVPFRTPRPCKPLASGLLCPKTGEAFPDVARSLTFPVACQAPTPSSHSPSIPATFTPEGNAPRLTRLARDEAYLPFLGSKQPVAPKRLSSCLVLREHRCSRPSPSLLLAQESLAAPSPLRPKIQHRSRQQVRCLLPRLVRPLNLGTPCGARGVRR
jgi:hypothetical protein